MKILASSLFIGLLASSQAFALRKAGPMDSQEIILLNRIQQGIDQVRLLEFGTDHNHPAVGTIKYFQDMIDEANGGIDNDQRDTKAKVSRWERQIATIRAQQEILCRPILQDAIDLYQIRPIPPIKDILDGPLKGLTNKWRPVVGEAHTQVFCLAPRGPRTHLRTGAIS